MNTLLGTLRQTREQLARRGAEVVDATRDRGLEALQKVRSGAVDWRQTLQARRSTLDGRRGASGWFAFAGLQVRVLDEVDRVLGGVAERVRSEMKRLQGLELPEQGEPATGAEVDAAGVDTAEVDAAGVDAAGVDAAGVDTAEVDAAEASIAGSGAEPVNAGELLGATEPASELLDATEPASEPLNATEPASESLDATEPASESLDATEADPAGEPLNATTEPESASEPLNATEPVNASESAKDAAPKRRKAKSAKTREATKPAKGARAAKAAKGGRAKSAKGVEAKTASGVTKAASANGATTPAPKRSQRLVFPITDYDALSAKAVLAELPRLSQAQCETVREHELAHKTRKSILRALDARLES